MSVIFDHSLRSVLLTKRIRRRLFYKLPTLLPRSWPSKPFLAVLHGFGDQPVSKRKRNTQDSGDFPELSVTEAVHFKGDASAFRQLRQGFHDARILVLVKCNGLRRGIDVGAGSGGLFEILVRDELAFACHAPPAIERQVANDPVKIAGRVLQESSFRGFVEAQPGLLNKLFRLRVTPDDVARVVHERTPMCHENTESRRILVQRCEFLLDSPLGALSVTWMV